MTDADMEISDVPDEVALMDSIIEGAIHMLSIREQLTGNRESFTRVSAQALYDGGYRRVVDPE